MKKIIAFALCAVMALSIAACGSNKKAPEIPDPFTEYFTIDEAAKAVGFDISVPDAIDGYTDRIIRADVESKMIEVIYKNGDDTEIRIRKADGAEDISGDYTKYSQSSTVTIGDLNVTMKGENDNVSVATWTNGDYAYSITSSTEQSKVSMTDLVNAVDAVDMIGGDPATWDPALDTDDNSGAEIPDPFVEYSSVDEAVKAVGFDFSFPETIDGYSDRVIRVDSESGMIEVVYKNSDDAEIRIRKAIGTEDISGDYTKYAQENAVTVGALNVTMKGANDSVSVATWASGGYTYSIGAYAQAGISVDVMTRLITSVK